eukprot:SAG31_NODE_17838_length_656_cov_0.935368_2_plen_79_part_01
MRPSLRPGGEIFACREFETPGPDGNDSECDPEAAPFFGQGGNCEKPTTNVLQDIKPVDMDQLFRVAGVAATADLVYEEL